MKAVPGSGRRCLSAGHRVREEGKEATSVLGEGSASTRSEISLGDCAAMFAASAPEPLNLEDGGEGRTDGGSESQGEKFRKPQHGAMVAGAEAGRERPRASTQVKEGLRT
eukprot:437216-Rhodomonas_salina.2